MVGDWKVFGQINDGKIAVFVENSNQLVRVFRCRTLKIVSEFNVIHRDNSFLENKMNCLAFF